ncbi:hypothetical protein AX16_010308 [Volvariella volvacea WC 439]|nr:hypothetical protein AX16_010308 [Volvariella volvacea WC 439]
MATTEPATAPSVGQLLKHGLRFVVQRYRKLNLYGKVCALRPQPRSPLTRAAAPLACRPLLCFSRHGLLLPLDLSLIAPAGVLIIVLTPSRIAQYLYDHATMLAQFRFGWLVLSLAIVGISFPPLVGHTTLVTLCGFAYGIKGFFIALPASVIGAAIVFSVLRLVFKSRLRNWSAKNDKWQALEAVVREKGLLLIILIRISPFPPWVYSNSLFASIESVALWQFVIATCCVAPKLLLHTFIGSRLAALSDGDQRSHMDTQTKVLNAVFIGGGVCVAIFTSWWIYTLLQKHIKHTDNVPPEVIDEALEELDEEAPLLPSFNAQDARS